LRKKSRHKLNTYEWIAVFNTEVTALVNDGYMQVFTLITAIGKVVLLALFMTSTAFTSYFNTGRRELFVSIVPFFILPPVICCYLALRLRGANDMRHDVVVASVRLRQFSGECVLHYRTIADYWSRPVVLGQIVRLTGDFNKKVADESRRKANDGAFFGWLMKLVEFCAIFGLSAVVINGGIKIGTFAAVLAGLKSAAQEFQGAYHTMVTMQACFPYLWRCVRYLNLPNDLWERRDKLSEVRRWFGERVDLERLQAPGEIPEDRIPLRVESITFAYQGGTLPIFRSLTLAINQGELVAILGPRSSGKNTLLQILAGLLLPTAGSINVPPHLRVLHLRYEQHLWDRPLSDTLYFGWMAAHGVTRVEDLDEHTIAKGLDICKELELHKNLVNTIEREVRSRTNPSIKGIGKLADTSDISKDSSYRLQLACALLAHPEVLVVHTPVAHAAWNDGGRLMDVLRRYVDERGMCSPPGQVHIRRPRTCVVSMEKPVYLEKAHRVLEIEDGQVRQRTAHSIS